MIDKKNLHRQPISLISSNRLIHDVRLVQQRRFSVNHSEKIRLSLNFRLVERNAVGGDL